MSSPDLTAAEITVVEEVLTTPNLSIGPRLTEVEERFAGWIVASGDLEVGLF